MILLSIFSLILTGFIIFLLIQLQKSNDREAKALANQEYYGQLSNDLALINRRYSGYLSRHGINPETGETREQELDRAALRQPGYAQPSISEAWYRNNNYFVPIGAPIEPRQGIQSGVAMRFVQEIPGWQSSAAGRTYSWSEILRGSSVTLPLNYPKKSKPKSHLPEWL